MTSSSVGGLGSTNTGSGVLGTTNTQFQDTTFLTLLTTQLQNQTPLEPVDNAAFMNQMASFSSMTQQQELNGNMLKLLDYQGLLARLQGLSEGSALLGKQVTYVNDSQQSLQANVQSIYINDQGEVHARLSDGGDVTMRQITAIGQAAPAS
jgi:flagellar basal-body rod modification protein FlgD